VDEQSKLLSKKRRFFVIIAMTYFIRVENTISQIRRRLLDHRVDFGGMNQNQFATKTGMENVKT
jgi:hypothetical protein